MVKGDRREDVFDENESSHRVEDLGVPSTEKLIKMVDDRLAVFLMKFAFGDDTSKICKRELTLVHVKGLFCYFSMGKRCLGAHKESRLIPVYVLVRDCDIFFQDRHKAQEVARFGIKENHQVICIAEMGNNRASPVVKRLDVMC
ncbi:unnamed protein product [Cuscuta campestris]|uniref:Uncharacterized protein n=1 Tax=Cuscuta campestris TaxID=132261 RepID=A0A484NSK9_9ASTE|nr:unnamed protein product [Cuscuta campestris]